MILLLLLMAGCATPSFKAADCVRYRHNSYNVLVCNDDSVNIHCSKGQADDGSKEKYFTRACLNPAPESYGRRPNIIIGKSYMGCIDHEICHLEHPQDPMFCMKKFPCVEDRQKGN